MKMKTRQKILSRIKDRTGGLSVAIAVLLLLIMVMLCIIAVPAWKSFRYRSQKVGCDQAMKSAGDGLIIEYLGSLEETTTEQARRILDKVMPGRDELCPAGGEVYLSKDENGIYQPFCGIHGNDKKERVRLNASYARDLLSEQLEKQAEKKPEATVKPEAASDRQASGAEEEEEPSSEYIEITINNRVLKCVHVLKEEPLRRGTDTTNGYEGIVAFYGIEGEGAFNSGLVKNGEIAYFVYADEYYCARWRAKDGWSGDAYS